MNEEIEYPVPLELGESYPVIVSHPPVSYTRWQPVNNTPTKTYAEWVDYSSSYC